MSRTSLIVQPLMIALATLWPALTMAEVPQAVVTDLQIPWECNQEYNVSQGNHGSTHSGWGRYAWDFSTPKGTVVTAPADGVVRKVRDDSTRYGCDSRFGWDANYVVIEMDNGYDVLLLHLKAESSLVEEGDPVVVGQPVGRVGNSGWVCGTHLHLQVQRRCSSWWCPSVPATFADSHNPSTGTAMRADSCESPDSSDESHHAAGPYQRLWRILSVVLPRGHSFLK